MGSRGLGCNKLFLGSNKGFPLSCGGPSTRVRRVPLQLRARPLVPGVRVARCCLLPLAAASAMSSQVSWPGTLGGGGGGGRGLPAQRRSPGADCARAVTQEEFDKAAEGAKNLPKGVSNDDMLALYGLFKQANVGDNTTSAHGPGQKSAHSAERPTRRGLVYTH